MTPAHPGRPDGPSSPAPGPAARDAFADALGRRLRGPGSPGSLDVLRTTVGTLLDAVPADVWCAVMLDPATLLDTGGLHEHGFPQQVMPRLFAIEHADQEGVDNVRALTRRRGTASLLSASMRGRMADSVYYRDVLRPVGLSDELRVLLRDGPRTWGLLVLCRGPGAPPFTAAETALAAAVSAPATAALRRSLLLTGIDRDDVPDAAGLLVVDDALRVRLATATAERWLALIQEAHPPAGRSLPYALNALVQTARTAAPGSQVRSRAIGATGHWVTLTAWREAGAGTLPGPLGGEGGEGSEGDEVLTVVSLAPTHPRELTALVLDAYGLTPRERQVAQQVLLGRSTAEMSAKLHIAEYTVQDHLRKVFDKAGVRSRRDFSGELFRRCYLPRLDDPPLTKDGRMRDDGAGGAQDDG
ncbi:helix-turn-helix transcriptional regulator [Streptomyces tsukubensis]